MDINMYALEILARDRLHQARAEAAARALRARVAARPARGRLRVSLGLALVGLGRWLRGDVRRGAGGVFGVHGREVGGARP